MYWGKMVEGEGAKTAKATGGMKLWLKQSANRVSGRRCD